MPHIGPGRRSGVQIRLDQHESALLLDLAEQMRALLEGQDEHDPVIRRVFPAAYGTEEDARSFKELTEHELKSTKIAALESITKHLGSSKPVDMPLSTEEAEMWLTALTDMRLALGIRLGVTEETMSSELDPSDPDTPTLSALHWLGWLQESVLDALRRSPTAGG